MLAMEAHHVITITESHYFGAQVVTKRLLIINFIDIFTGEIRDESMKVKNLM